MNKNIKKKIKVGSTSNPTIRELSALRDGGQIALKGYSYQFLYSCYLIISSSSENTSFQLEGIEDIDYIRCNGYDNNITHIQLKYSTNKQDASFFKDILINFLEVYLLDQNRFFKLVYDFPVAKGNLSKLFESNLDDKSRLYWNNIIKEISNNYPQWNWSAYDFDKFFSHLLFENIRKNALEAKIEMLLIDKYEITTDNILLFVNSLKILCLEKMEQRDYITKNELNERIQSVKIDISKGFQNPAHSWIRKLNYTNPNIDIDYSFYEGKKAAPIDIVRGLPIRRHELEQKIVESISKYVVTVIKASSGQGKTTVALQVAYELQKEYIPYQLLLCDDNQKLGNIIQYFKARIQLGEKPLILIDNLDANLKRWNSFVQLMQSEVFSHYRVLITSRETDWYNYGGDISHIQSLNVIKPTLNEKEAKDIFNIFKNTQRLHPEIISWQKAWNKIADKQLLIEYVYMLSHGEMLSERISSQMSEIGVSPLGKIKCEILRKVCFADICGIRLSIINLIESQSEPFENDYSELLKSMKDEFLINVSDENNFIEGLHPIRSKHIIDRLHEFFPIEKTALSVIKIVNESDLAILFSHLQEFNINKHFFHSAVELLWNKNNLSNYIYAIQGLFSGAVMHYYNENKRSFDDANIHGGLAIISMELCPFTRFDEFDVSVTTLKKMKENFPQSENIEYLCKLRDNTPKFNLCESYLSYFCTKLYEKMRNLNFMEFSDSSSYAVISEWLYGIDSNFNLSVNIPLYDIWVKPEKFSLDCISSLMYVSFCGNKELYMKFVNSNIETILTYFKYHTKSQKIYIDDKKDAIHVEYILRLSDIDKSNEKSVSRLKIICKALPIFKLYCADAIKPEFNALSGYTIPDDSHKEMPIENVVITFHQNFASLWNKTIMSNYECDTVEEWLEHWVRIRKCICTLFDKCCVFICKILGKESIGGVATEIDKVRIELDYLIVKEVKYPKEERPFDKDVILLDGLSKIKNEYFHSIKNFSSQLKEFVCRDTQKQKLALFNLEIAKGALSNMQNFFYKATLNTKFHEIHSNLCVHEIQCSDLLLMYCKYYTLNNPNNHFNKHYIKAWYNRQRKLEIDSAKSELFPLQSICDVNFPNNIYNIKNLRYYPIIIDILDNDNSGQWLIECIPFINSSFDYLVILFKDNLKRIQPIALSITKYFLERAKQTIESGDDTLLKDVNLPYPVEVTEQMLNCFNEKYDIALISKSNTNTSFIGNLAEELWDFSKLTELLTAPEDSNYLKESLKEIENNVLKILKSLEDDLSFEEMNYISDLCHNVFAGHVFDNVSFNKLIENYTIKN